MKPISLLFAVAALFATPLFSKVSEIPTDQMQKVKPATLKVLLKERQDKILLEVKGPYKVFCPHTNVLISSSTRAKRTTLRPQTAGLFWGDSFPGFFGVRIVPSNNLTTILVNGIQYKGCLEVYDVGGQLRVINEVDVENYLSSCLATQFSHIKEPEVLNALAIVARTNAYYKIQAAPKAPWHVTASEEGYQGYGATAQYLPLEAAIQETHHAILTYQEKPFAACWNENSGGKTASFSSIYRQNVEAPKGTSIDGMESERLKSCWSFQISKQELANLAHLAKVANISVFSEKESGKVYAVKVADGTSTKTMDFFALQNAIGKSKLKSNDFTMEVLDQSVRFKGFGIGNGVGLCVYTAQLMAKQGLDAKRILSQFFADTKLEKVKTLPSSTEKSF